MGKKKLTAKQKQARKKSQYVKREYMKTLDAITFIKDYINIPDIKIPNKITRSSLKSIREKYKKARKKLKEAGNAFLPTKQEMIKVIREEREATPTYSSIENEPFNPVADYFDELHKTLNEITPHSQTDRTEKNFDEKVVSKAQRAISRIENAINTARKTLGDEQTAQILAENDYVQRIENLKEKYAFEIVESIDDDLIPLIEASVSNALE